MAVVSPAEEKDVARYADMFAAIGTEARLRIIRLLLSEDLQDGFTWRGVTVANPFSASPHPLLAGLLE